MRYYAEGVMTMEMLLKLLHTLLIHDIAHKHIHSHTIRIIHIQTYHFFHSIALHTIFQGYRMHGCRHFAPSKIREKKEERAVVAIK